MESHELKCFRHDIKNPHSISTNEITSISASEDKSIWVSTYWKGIQKFDKKNKNFIPYDKKNVKGLPEDQFWCVKDLGRGMVLAGHVNKGLSVIDTHHHVAHNYRHNASNPKSLSGNEVYAILQDHHGTIWIGTGKGLDIFNPATHEFTPVAEREIDHQRIYDIKEFKDGRVWVATELKGIVIIDAQKSWQEEKRPSIQVITKGERQDALTGNCIRCLWEDSYHNIWAGVYGSGINFLTRQRPPFQKLSYGPLSINDALTSRSVTGITFDQTGELWIGTDGEGTNLFSKDLLRKNIYPVETGKNIRTILCDSKGVLWFGSFWQGVIIRKKDGSFQRLLKEYWADVRCFYEDKLRHDMWVGTNLGIYIIDTGTYTVKSVFKKGSQFIRSITRDSKDRVWLGYLDHGIEVFTPRMEKRIATFSTATTPEMPSNAVSQIFEDSQHRIWAASHDGIVCFDINNLKHTKLFSEEQGLSNTHVCAIAEDNHQNLWFSTNTGISCLRKGISKFDNFDYRQNVPQGNFFAGSATKDKQGNIYFGSNEGLCYFNPQALIQPKKSSQICITSIHLPNGIGKKDSIIDVINQKDITLKHNENTVTLNFCALNYADNLYTLYKYKVEGLQDRWEPCDGNITLRNLPPGKYKCIITTYNNIGTSHNSAVLSIVITPPFWLSGWAKALYILLTLIFAYFILQSYKRHLNLKYLLKAEQQEHEKELKFNEERLRFFTNITHELRTPLTLIISPLEDLSHSTSIGQNIKHKLAMIYQNAIRLNDLITQILEFRKTETAHRQLSVCQGNIVETVQEICLRYEELVQKPNVSIRFVAPCTNIGLYFDREIIRIIVDNLVSNAIKYTDKGYIEIGVSTSQKDGKNLVNISVSDTGHGISPDALPHVFDRYYQENSIHQASGTGIGLALVKNLVMLHEGDIQVESQPEVGTRFILSLDRDKQYSQALHGANNSCLTHKHVAEIVESDNEQEEIYIGKKPSMLIVEDNKDIREYIANSFEQDFEILTAIDGKEGLTLAFEKIPDIVISDVMMPNMDGKTMCVRLKNDIRTSHIPIILLTAKESIEAKIEGYDAGADSYITKPFSRTLLSSRVRNLLAKRKQALKSINESKEIDILEKKKRLRESLNKIDQTFFDKINKIIEDNICGTIDVNFLAESLAMSTSTLYRKVKTLTGLSTNEYIRKIKMQHAERLLLEGKYNISEVGYMVGMNSLPYFRQCFKSEFGMIPSEYLKQIQK